MTKLKNSLIASASLMLLVGVLGVLPPALRRAQGSGDRKSSTCEPRRFYLTITQHDGNETLSACAAGYHMASLWEIRDPSNLRYDTTLGFTRGDSGSGPPSDSFGWVRTGWDPDQSGLPGSANCNAWTSDSPFGEGAAVGLPRIWRSTDVTLISPWISFGVLCFDPIQVWCVQD